MITSLLPHSTTALERAYSLLGLGELDAMGDLPAGVQITLPPGFAPVLAAQYFLGQFAEYFDTPEALLDAGLPWLRERGTGASVVRALSWIGIDSAVEEDGALLHLDPGSPRAPARLDDIRLLLEASIPAHVLFYRLFHGYDVRHARLDRSRWDYSLLDDDSGLLVDGLKLSFGERIAAELPAPARGLGHWIEQTTAVTLRRDTMYWDSWVLDGEWQVDLFGGVGGLVSTQAPARDLPPPVFSRGDLMVSAALREALTAAAAAGTALATLAPARHPGRRWAGPWSRPWRLVVPFSTYPED